MPESILKDIFPRAHSGGKARYRKPATDSLRDIAEGAGRLWERRWLRRASVSALVVMLSAGGALAYVQMRPRAVPDIFADDLSDVLDYTLLTDAFNNLPVDERLAILKRLIARLKSMDSNDSALVSGFAAGIGARAREQLMKNSERLMVDIWDKFAAEYTMVKPEDREAYLDKAFVDMTKMFEDVSGFNVPVKDEDRVAEAKRQAKRDEQRMKGASERPVNAERAAGFMGFVNERGQKHTSAEQRGRMAALTRDMTRRFRGQDIRTGKPLEGATPPAPPGAAPSAPPGAPVPPAGN
ncbi:MAG TPA: hypothetical protein VEB22_11815 [Phycisphaerales bacterium]|nr:hypothetical protein [Phycisphaerales bacterium]